jgi:hypothetical protein
MDSSASSVTESGNPVEDAAGVRLVRREPGSAVVEVGSGTYRFEVSSQGR